MATISIWGKYQGKVEKIDTANSERQAQYLTGEYQLAFGPNWQVWYGRKDKEGNHTER